MFFITSLSILFCHCQAQSTSNYCYVYGTTLNLTSVSDIMNDDIIRVKDNNIGLNDPNLKKTYLAGFDYTFLFPTVYLQALYEK